MKLHPLRTLSMWSHPATNRDLGPHRHQYREDRKIKLAMRKKFVAAIDQAIAEVEKERQLEKVVIQ